MGEILEVIFGIACSFLILMAGMLIMLWSLLPPGSWPMNLFAFAGGFILIFISFKGLAYFVGR